MEKYYSLLKEFSKLKAQFDSTWKDQPTEDGYYWIKAKNNSFFDKDIPAIVRVFIIDEKYPWYCATGNEDEYLISKTTAKWYGPIDVPSLLK